MLVLELGLSEEQGVGELSLYFVKTLRGAEDTQILSSGRVELVSLGTTVEHRFQRELRFALICLGGFLILGNGAERDPGNTFGVTWPVCVVGSLPFSGALPSAFSSSFCDWSSWPGVDYQEASWALCCWNEVAVGFPEC